jgi:hypothetical protein
MALTMADETNEGSATARVHREDNGMLLVRCPGCAEGEWSVGFHAIDERWTFNGNYERPTFSPSLLATVDFNDGRRRVCHSFIRDGRIEYLSDCTHSLAGQTIELPAWRKDSA